MEASDWLIVGVCAVLIVAGGFAVFSAAFWSDVPDKFYLNDTMTRAMNDALAQTPKPEAEGEFWRMAFLPLKKEGPARPISKALRDALTGYQDGSKFRGPDVDYAAEELERDFKAPFVVENEADALKVGTHLGVDVVAWGEQLAFADGPDATEVSFRVAFEKMPVDRIEPLPKQIGRVEVSRKLSKSALSLQYVRLRLSQTSSLWRILYWFLFAAALPFAFYPIAMKVFEADSNAANMTVLIVLTALTLAAALTLNGLAFSGAWVVLYIGLVVASGAYNLALLNAFQEGN